MTGKLWFCGLLFCVSSAAALFGAQAQPEVSSVKALELGELIGRA